MTLVGKNSLSRKHLGDLQGLIWDETGELEQILLPFFLCFNYSAQSYKGEAGGRSMGLRSSDGVNPQMQVVAVTGGKGGVGKSNFSVNVAVAMAMAGKKVMVFDGDLGLANIDVLLGMTPEKNLHHVLTGQCDLRDILVEGPEGIRVVPSASGISSMFHLSVEERGGLIAAFDELGQDTDVLIVDTASGISPTTLGFCLAAQDIVIVVRSEPTSISDAYALIKILNEEHHVEKVHVVTNLVQDKEEGLVLYDSLRGMSEQFLDVTLNHLGSIPNEEKIIQSIRQQTPLVKAYPDCAGARSMVSISHNLMTHPRPSLASGGMGFFMEKILANQTFPPPTVKKAAIG